MSTSKKVTILYFTDLLCVWAYIAQIRIEQLKIKFGSSIIIQDHFVSVFGAVELKMEKNWANKGGISAYSKFVHEKALKFDHIEVHPDIWKKNTPTSSSSCHLILKAIQILESHNEIQASSNSDHIDKSIFEVVAGELRLAFFRDLKDISNYKVQMEIIEKLGLPHQKIEEIIQRGFAFAALENDFQLKEEFGVSGSPSLVLNEGRQIIYGNVGYRVIEANIQELLSQSDNQASWC
ncbi:MAG: disulfide bond formation protein DsbA [Gammaproteobacteria bacterium]|nr:disulfide bond formation protein DsbA [Gammaproteobacteria bacterium]